MIVFISFLLCHRTWFSLWPPGAKFKKFCTLECPRTLFGLHIPLDLQIQIYSELAVCRVPLCSYLSNTCYSCTFLSLHNSSFVDVIKDFSHLRKSLLIIAFSMFMPNRKFSSSRLSALQSSVKKLVNCTEITCYRFSIPYKSPLTAMSTFWKEPYVLKYSPKYTFVRLNARFFDLVHIYLHLCLILIFF